MGEDRLPHGRAQGGGRRGSADDVLENKLERPADLKKTGEQVRGVDTSREFDRTQTQKMVQVVGISAVACDPSPAGCRGHVNLMQILGIPLVEQEHHDIGVQGDLAGGGGSAAHQTVTHALDETGGDLGRVALT